MTSVRATAMTELTRICEDFVQIWCKGTDPVHGFCSQPPNRGDARMSLRGMPRDCAAERLARHRRATEDLSCLNEAISHYIPLCWRSHADCRCRDSACALTPAEADCHPALSYLSISAVLAASPRPRALCGESFSPTAGIWDIWLCCIDTDPSAQATPTRVWLLARCKLLKLHKLV